MSYSVEVLTSWPPAEMLAVSLLRNVALGLLLALVVAGLLALAGGLPADDNGGP